MTRLLLDTNILLDAAGRMREGNAAARALLASDPGKVQLAISVGSLMPVSPLRRNGICPSSRMRCTVLRDSPRMREASPMPMMRAEPASIITMLISSRSLLAGSCRACTLPCPRADRSVLGAGGRGRES